MCNAAENGIVGLVKSNKLRNKWQLMNRPPTLGAREPEMCLSRWMWCMMHDLTPVMMHPSRATQPTG